MMRTSITDVPDYVAYCAAAASDDRVFVTFRRAWPIVRTYEHVDEALGQRCLDVVRRDAPQYLEPQNLERIQRNDQVGSPRLARYAEGWLSPVTLRYLKVLSDLERLFGDLTGMSILEIGVGYGGQCRLICEFCQVRSYTLIDLPPVLALARRYLGGVEGLTFLSPEDIRPARYDLLVSNYAFSELGRRAQEDYASLVKADRGYMTCTVATAGDSWGHGELEGLHPGARWLPEEPLTWEGNSLLVWGTP